jgi:hypothetical protein
MFMGFIKEKSSAGELNETQFADLWKDTNFTRSSKTLSEATIQNAMLKIGSSLQR